MKTLNVSFRYGVTLGITALICTALSVGFYFLTQDRIQRAIATQQQELLSQIIPSKYYDNDLLASCTTFDIEILKQTRIDKICTAQKNHLNTAYIYETVATDGYSGNIRLIVGITLEGKILGVRVTNHNETPGLGDKIELRISDWILSFNDQQIDPNNLGSWAVKKDGGKFDQFTGATITPRAVVNQVKQSALAILQFINYAQLNNEQHEDNAKSKKNTPH